MDGAEKGRRGVTLSDHAPSPTTGWSPLPRATKLGPGTRLEIPEAGVSLETAALEVAHAITAEPCSWDTPPLHAIALEGRPLPHYPLLAHRLQLISLRAVQHRVRLRTCQRVASHHLLPLWAHLLLLGAKTVALLRGQHAGVAVGAQRVPLPPHLLAQGPPLRKLHPFDGIESGNLTRVEVEGAPAVEQLRGRWGARGNHPGAHLAALTLRFGHAKGERHRQ